ncbi:MAG: hypothetical protein JNM50_12795 [Chromatiales bacterium]|nr:hypothetical protein [Chromatiales bacterium]
MQTDVTDVPETQGDLLADAEAARAIAEYRRELRRATLARRRQADALDDARRFQAEAEAAEKVCARIRRTLLPIPTGTAALGGAL